MSAVLPKSNSKPDSKTALNVPYMGPVDWRRMVDWLGADGVISAAEAQRTVARCSQAESAQHPLVRLANVAMQRASDGKPLDIETLTQYLAAAAAAAPAPRCCPRASV